MALSDALSSIASSLDGLLVSAEARRQRRTGDVDYVKSTVVIFELRLPASLAGLSGGSVLFPLTLPPQAMSMSEPFAVDPTPTQRSGLFVEEGGVVQRRIRIRGTTGFWPMPVGLSSDLTVAPPSGTSFSRQLPPVVRDTALSGQRHLQILQDKVFRLYSDAKRDPSTAADTQLFLHDVQAGEHWLVAPMAFGVDRSAQSPLTCSYDIDLLVLDKARPLPVLATSRDRSLLQAMGDVLRSTQGFLRRANAAVNDLTSVQSELSLAVHDVGSTVNLAASLVGAVGNFVAGITELVRSPYQAIFAVAQACENVLVTVARLRELGVTVANWPRPIERRFRALTTAAEQLGLTPRAFVPVATTLRARQRVAVAGSGGTQSLSSFAAIVQRGSAGMPSDGELRAARTQQGLEPSDYPYTRGYTVRQGDSLSSLSARFFGDPRAWSLLASANGLPSPVLPTAPAGPVSGPMQGSTLRVGQALLVPTQVAPPATVGNAAVLGARPEQPPEVQALGVDLRTRVDARGQRDLEMGDDGGAADLAVVQGEDNLEQALRARIRVEQGSAPLYPGLGLPAIVGTGQASADWQQVQLRVQQALLADPRVAGVTDVSLSTALDAVGVDVTVRRVDTAQASVLTIAA